MVRMSRGEIIIPSSGSFVCLCLFVRVVVWVGGVRVYGEGQEEQGEDEPALCSMEMELYCSAA